MFRSAFLEPLRVFLKRLSPVVEKLLVGDLLAILLELLDIYCEYCCHCSKCSRDCGNASRFTGNSSQRRYECFQPFAAFSQFSRLPRCFDLCKCLFNPQQTGLYPEICHLRTLEDKRIFRDFSSDPGNFLNALLILGNPSLRTLCRFSKLPRQFLYHRQSHVAYGDTKVLHRILSLVDLGFRRGIALFSLGSQGVVFLPRLCGKIGGVGQDIVRRSERKHRVGHSDFGDAHVVQDSNGAFAVAFGVVQSLCESGKRLERILLVQLFESVLRKICDLCEALKPVPGFNGKL